jgi:hypothetical protein
MHNQPRLILLLDTSEEAILAKQILKSPLGLAHRVIQYLFENRFSQLKDDLDSIKQFVAGIGRTSHLNDYQLAHYYPYFFAYHQHFHSAYRATQGKVLEALIQEWVKTSHIQLDVSGSTKQRNTFLKRVLPDYDSKLDVDAVIADKNRVLCVQLRSRDDTGGTTAKGSLVQATLYMMRQSNIAPDSHIHYVVGIWDVRNRQQEISTKQKLYDYLEKDISLSKAEFFDQLSSGLRLRPHLTLQLCYGYTEMAQVISDWAGGIDSQALEDLITLIGESDDLWLAYLVAHLELESIELYGQNNIIMLNEALSHHTYSTQTFKTSQAYVSLANDLAQKIATDWHADFPFLHTLSEKIVYIRDLILLKFVYDSLSKS